MALEQALGGPAKRLLGRAEQVDAVAPVPGESEELLHEVDPGHALGHRIAQETGGPDDGLAVRRHQLGARDDRPEARIGPEGDELRSVERHVLQEAALLDRPTAEIDRLAHAHAIDLAPEDDRTTLSPRAHVGTESRALPLCPVSAAARTAAARSPARPSQRGIGAGSVAGVGRIAGIALGSSPSSVFVPALSVIGRSVFARSV